MAILDTGPDSAVQVDLTLDSLRRAHARKRILVRLDRVRYDELDRGRRRFHLLACLQVTVADYLSRQDGIADRAIFLDVARPRFRRLGKLLEVLQWAASLLLQCLRREQVLLGRAYLGAVACLLELVELLANLDL